MYKILAIDENSLFLEILIELLKMKGCKAIDASTGRLGIQLAKAQMPDLIICEIRMPDLDGFKVVETLRQDPLTKNIPLILFSNFITSEERLTARKLGANDCIDKFCTFEELFKIIKTQIEKSFAVDQVEIQKKNFFQITVQPR